jgi:hypothetical protein
MKRTTTTTGTALLIATMGLITFAQVTRAGGHGSGGGRSFGRSLGSINRGSGSFGGMQSSIIAVAAQMISQIIMRTMTADVIVDRAR